MRRFFMKILIISLLSFLLFPMKGQAVQGVSAKHAILMEQATGQVLFEKEANVKQSVASITKVMTAILAIEYGNLQDEVPISERAIYTEGSAIYLADDTSMSLEDLIYGLMLRSGNDASIAIAEHVGGSVEGFSYLMNEKARMIGMNNSSFMNPHGLEEENHYSTAHDIALLIRYAMRDETFQKISGTTAYLSESRTYKWQNKNKLLTSLYKYCTGGKTGFTKKAGRTLVTTATKGTTDLIVVTLDAPDDWNDHIALFEWGFNNYEMQPDINQGFEEFLNYQKKLIKPEDEDVYAQLKIEKQNSDDYFVLWLDVLKQMIRLK